MAKYISQYTGEQIDAAVNKANTALQQHQDISGKQDKNDSSLQTTSKQVVGAINELNSGKVGFSDYAGDSTAGVIFGNLYGFLTKALTISYFQFCKDLPNLLTSGTSDEFELIIRKEINLSASV